jgi:hypothetical protein
MRRPLKDSTIIDTQTGEIIGGKIEFVDYKKQDEFIQDYVHLNIASVMKLTKVEHQVLAACKLVSLNIRCAPKDMGNPVSLGNGMVSNSIAEMCGIKVKTVYKAMNDLVKLGLIFKNEKYKGSYYLNPKYFFAGCLGDRNRLVKTTVTHEFLKTEVEPAQL